MAKTNESEKSLNFFQKFILFFKNFGLRIVRSFREMFAELKKVTWPTRKELMNYTLIVLGFMAVMAVIIGVLDAGAAWLVSVLLGL